jgi:hypothetical protein
MKIIPIERWWNTGKEWRIPMELSGSVVVAKYSISFSIQLTKHENTLESILVIDI